LIKTSESITASGSEEGTVSPGQLKNMKGKTIELKHVIQKWCRPTIRLKE
jgi:hypothetical protein